MKCLAILQVDRVDRVGRFCQVCQVGQDEVNMKSLFFCLLLTQISSSFVSGTVVNKCCPAGKVFDSGLDCVDAAAERVRFLYDTTDGNQERNGTLLELEDLPPEGERPLPRSPR